MMKQTIWKEIIEPNDTIALTLPKGAEILSCQVQHNEVCVWYLCDPTQPKEARVLRVIGTGHPVVNEELKFIDTIQLGSGILVFHIFEQLKVWD